MSYRDLPGEHHFMHRIGWLRATVLGANDGIVSTASLVIGVAAAGSTNSQILVAGVAGLVAGAMSMAAGEFISVSSQSDTERADLATERAALRDFPEAETLELARIYEARGLAPELAMQVAQQLMATDALGAHARDELGITEVATAKPVQAALSSAASFAAGAALPLVAAWAAPVSQITWVASGVSLAALAILGGVSASIGGAGKIRAVLRVVFWGALAMAATALIGRIFGTVV